MTTNWNDLSDEQRARALAEGVLGWKLVVHTIDTDTCMGDLSLHDWEDRDGLYVCDIDCFNPLTDPRHSKMLWDALTPQQRKKVIHEMGSHCLDQVEHFGDMLDAEKLSKAIYTVAAGGE